MDRADVQSQYFDIVYHIKDPLGDLCLLKMNTSVKFIERIKPVCLSQPQSNVPQPLMEISWGIKNMLRKEKLDVLTNAKCNETHKEGADRTRICASREKSDCGNWFDVRDIILPL